MTQFGGPRAVEPLDGDRYLTWDAAYVLGSLSSDRTPRIRSAPASRANAAARPSPNSSGMPALLGLLDADDVAALDERAARAAAVAARGAAVGAGQGALAPAPVAVADVGRVGDGRRAAGGRSGDRDPARDRGPAERRRTQPSPAVGDEQGRADAVQRDGRVEQLRLGHPHRHGVHLRRLVGWRRCTAEQPRHGRRRSRRQPHRRSRRGSGCPAPPRCPAATRRCRWTKSLPYNWFPSDSGKVLLERKL